VNVDTLIADAAALIAVPSTADRPADLRRALDLVIGRAGPDSTPTSTWCPPRRSSSGPAATATGCTAAAPTT
jgi:hypothetical protein